MTDNKKLEAFREAVLSDGRRKAQEITDNAQQAADEYKKHLTDEETVSFARQSTAVESETSLLIQKETAGQELLAKRRVLSYREELIEGVFENAKNKLVQKASSPEHEKYVFACLDKIKAQYGDESGVCILSDKHMSLADKIKQKYGYACQSDDNMFLGGVMVKLEKRGVLIDNSVASALAEQRAGFAKNNSDIGI